MNYSMSSSLPAVQSGEIFPHAESVRVEVSPVGTQPESGREPAQNVLTYVKDHGIDKGFEALANGSIPAGDSDGLVQTIRSEEYEKKRFGQVQENTDKAPDFLENEKKPQDHLQEFLKKMKDQDPQGMQQNLSEIASSLSPEDTRLLAFLLLEILKNQLEDEKEPSAMEQAIKMFIYLLISMFAGIEEGDKYLKDQKEKGKRHKRRGLAGFDKKAYTPDKKTAQAASPVGNKISSASLPVPKAV